MKSKFRVQDFPRDLWAEVAGFLEEAIDVNSLQATCRSIRQILSTRGVWKVAFLNMCRRNSVFVPSFPNLDSMTSRDLQHAALRPYRLSKAMKDCSAVIGEEQYAPALKAVSTVPVAAGDFAVLSLRFSGSHTFLVPGGRFMLTMERWGDWLSLWDLGTPGEILHQPIWVAKVHLEQELRHAPGFRRADCSSLAVTSTDSGSLTIATSITREMSVFIQPFVIDLMASNPGFVRKGVLSIHAHPHHRRAPILLVNDNRIIISLGRSDDVPSIIWDFEEKWYAPGPKLGECVQQIVMAGDILVSFRDTDLCLWNISLVQATDKYSIESTTNLDKPIIYDHLKPSEAFNNPICLKRENGVTQDADHILTSSWYSNPSSFPIVFDAFDSLSPNLSRFRLNIHSQDLEADDAISLDHLGTYTLPTTYLLGWYNDLPNVLDPTFPFTTAKLTLQTSLSSARHTGTAPKSMPWVLYTLTPASGAVDCERIDLATPHRAGSRNTGNGGNGQLEQRLLVAKLPVNHTEGMHEPIFMGFCPWTGRLVYAVWEWDDSHPRQMKTVPIIVDLLD